MKSSQSKNSILIGLKPNSKIMYNFSGVMQPSHSEFTSDPS